MRGAGGVGPDWVKVRPNGPVWVRWAARVRLVRLCRLGRTRGLCAWAVQAGVCSWARLV